MATIENHHYPGYTLWRLTGDLGAFAADSSDGPAPASVRGSSNSA